MQQEQKPVFVAAKVPPLMRDELIRLAAVHDKTLSAEIRTAIRLHLSIQDSKEN
jgi:hypothetical protein